MPSVLDAQKKKKKGGGFMYGGAQPDAEEQTAASSQISTEAKPAETEEKPKLFGASKMMSAFTGVDSDEERKKKQKRERQGKKAKGNKKGAAAAQESEEEEAQKPQQDDEERKEEEPATVQTSADGMPIEVIYCKVCGVPPEYCMFDKKDSSECKALVLATHPELHDSIYGAPEPPKEGEAAATEAPQ